MSRVDLNLLTALDALLSERSVTAAAQRLNLSVSAMSRTLARLRAATGDRLLLQAGRSLVLTPYGEQLRQRLGPLTLEAQALLKPPEYRFDVAALEHSFAVRAGEGFIDLVGAALIERISRAAPGVQLRFMPKPDWDAQPLRDGTIDLEIGTVRTSAPEMRTRLLFRDRYVGACRVDHPLLSNSGVSVESWIEFGHILTARPGEESNPVDLALAKCGKERRVPMVVPSFTSAMQVARRSDLLAVIPRSCVGNPFVPDHAAVNGLQWFELPVSTPRFNVSAIWHPRLDHDQAHRWLRAEIVDVCVAAYPRDPIGPKSDTQSAR
ncbi:LysR family transcriptional regulator [Paraburkholderia sp. MMS20-SJTR3]|uniref:LysR family transcriptional regulator n=1 Tax=Paraburkholderia sejongensis TaxID=2886946 RepID=A0ABS8K6B6_9BURK|nr:LysR family transcriptional regulator [Paraburkholderia sp. MMS20-SJTR3]MCC8397464.1 LysR family transcriptional regulator [Paraburkholderia sp. MMS20-SJTR3]